MNEHSNKNGSSGLSGLSPKTSFLLGIGGTVGVFFVIGFFILFGLFVTNRGPYGSGGSKTAVAPSAVAPVRTAPPVTSGGISLVPVTDEDWVKGDRNAKVSVVEFSDLECPFCKRFHPTMKRLIQEYDGKVNWVYRHFPLASLHRKAAKEAEATECAGELGGNDGFWAYTDRIFEITPSNDGLDLNLLPQIAEDVGLDRDKFVACLDSGKYANKVADQYQQAVTAGGTGTPYSVIVAGDKRIPVSGAVPYQQLKNIIDTVL